MAEGKGKTPPDKKKEIEESPFSALLDEPIAKDPEVVTPELKKPEEDEGKDKKNSKTSDEIKQVLEETRLNSKKSERRSEASDFVNSDEGELFRKFSKEIKQAASDPRYFNVPIEQIPQLILKPAAYAKVLQDAREQADKEAKDSVTGGNSGAGNKVPDELKKVDIKNMSKEDFATLRVRAARGEFKIKQ